jgi:hypothetical protein
MVPPRADTPLIPKVRRTRSVVKRSVQSFTVRLLPPLSAIETSQTSELILGIALLDRDNDG